MQQSQDIATPITIVDLGTGNIGSLVNMLRQIGLTTAVASEPEQLIGATKLILPGVGHWDHAVRRIDEQGLREPLTELAMRAGVPTLGICLGMQLLLEGSDEGDLPGLGWIPGRLARFSFQELADRRLRVPHMGWNVAIAQERETLLSRGGSQERYYFAHSFHAVDVPAEHVFLTAHHGYDFACGVTRANVWGVQFHPEKSHRFGMELLRRFARVGACSELV